MEKKAQGAIEYLLIIGAAILVVAIVIIAITSVLNTSKTTGETALTDQQKQQNTLRCINDINALGNQNGKTGCTVGLTVPATAKSDCNCCLTAKTDVTQITLCK